MTPQDLPSLPVTQSKPATCAGPNCAVSSGSASEEIFNSEEYAKFVESMTHLCRCRSQDKPCDGVLAGGLCDDIQDDPHDDEETPSERYDREVYGDEWHTPMSL